MERDAPIPPPLRHGWRVARNWNAPFNWPRNSCSKRSSAADAPGIMTCWGCRLSKLFHLDEASAARQPKFSSPPFDRVPEERLCPHGCAENIFNRHKPPVTENVASPCKSDLQRRRNNNADNDHDEGDARGV